MSSILARHMSRCSCSSRSFADGTPASRYPERSSSFAREDVAGVGDLKPENGFGGGTDVEFEAWGRDRGLGGIRDSNGGWTVTRTPVTRSGAAGDGGGANGGGVGTLIPEKGFGAGGDGGGAYGGGVGTLMPEKGFQAAGDGGGA